MHKDLIMTFGSLEQAAMVFTGVPPTVTGGILSSTLLTLVVLPTLYAWFEREEKVEHE